MNNAFALLQSQSSLKTHTHTMRSMRAQIDEARKAATCIPLRDFKRDGENNDQKADERFAEPIFKKLPDYKGLSLTMSFLAVDQSSLELPWGEGSSWRSWASF